MTINDWLQTAMLVVSIIICSIAYVYQKSKAKINHASRVGMFLDTVGKMASFAVHEADTLDLTNDDKRAYASQAIKEALQSAGIKNVSDQMINGAIEKAVNTMHLANADSEATVTSAEVSTDEIADKVDDSQIIEPTATQAESVNTESSDANGSH